MDNDIQESPEMTAELDAAGGLLALAEKTNRFFAAAYLLELVGILNSTIKVKLDSISEHLGHPWQTEIEQQNNISASFSRKLYETLCERLLPHEAIAFILRGLGYSYPEVLIEELTSVTADSSSEQSR